MRTGAKLLLVVTGLILFVSVSDPIKAEEASNMISVARDQSVPILTLLEELGRKHGYFFTIEEAWTGAESINSFESIRVQISQPGRNVWQELEELQRVTLHFSYRVDPVNPRIVHIVDARLAQQKRYALESVLKNLDFTGTVHDLINALAKQGIGVSSQGVFDYYEGATIDFKTRVHVKGKRMSVRGRAIKLHSSRASWQPDYLDC